MENERFFNVGLGVFVFEPERFEHVRIFNFFLGRNRVLRFCRGAFAEHLRFVSQKGGALVEERVDLAIELPHAPAATQCFGLVKLPRLLACYRKQPDVSGPGERKLRSS